MAIINQFQTSSTTCTLSLPVDLDTRTGANDVDFEYSRENCVTETGFFSSTTTIPVSFNSPTTSTTSISSSTSFSVSPIFTGGEILIIFLMLIFMFMSITTYVLKGIDRIKTKRKYIQYSNGDVPIIEEN